MIDTKIVIANAFVGNNLRDCHYALNSHTLHSRYDILWLPEMGIVGFF